MNKIISKFSILLLIVLTLLSTISCAISTPDTINIIDQFQYKIGAFPTGGNISPIDSAIQNDSWNKFRTIQELSSEINPGDTVWFKVTIPELKYSSSGIYFEELYANSYEIYQGNDLVYRKNRKWFHNHNAIILPIKNSYTVTELYIKVPFFDTKIGPKSNVYVGAYKTLESLYFTKDFINIYIGFGLIFLSLIVLICSFLLRNNPKKIGLSLTFTILSLGIIVIVSSTNILMYFSNLEEILLILYDIALFYGFPLLTYFFSLVVSNKSGGIIQKLWRTQIVYSILCTIFMIVNIASGYSYNSLYAYFSSIFAGFLISIQLIILIGSGIYYSFKGNQNARIFIIGFSCFAIALFAELSIYFAVNKDYTLVFWKWGLLAFAVSLIVIFGKQYSKNHQIIDDYSNELKRIDALSKTDYLTTLPNRMEITNKLGAAIENYRSSNQNFALALCDIDNFKRLNDTYGHNFGDEVLVSLAQILKNAMRAADSVGRWGGEEFLIIISTENYDDAYHILDRLRNTISDHRFIHNNEIIKISATFGLCQYDDSQGIKNCLDFTDQALYHGKENGKNIVSIYENIPSIELENNSVETTKKTV